MTELVPPPCKQRMAGLGPSECPLLMVSSSGNILVRGRDELMVLTWLRGCYIFGEICCCF